MGIFNIGKSGNAGKLKSFSYSPGYSDMRGAYHRDSLEKNDDGKWVFISRKRECHSEPTAVTTYSVSEGSASEFEAYIKKINLIKLTKRPKSNIFVTDYSPWSYSVVFDCSSAGGSSYDDYGISEYKMYSPADMKMLKDVNNRFYSLKGDLISETEEND